MRQASPAFVRLSLTHFMYFRDLDIALEPGPVVLTGPNGAGKTNILEAVSMFAPGGGLRQARLGEVDLRLPGNSTGMAWAAHARVIVHDGEISLGTGRDPLGPQQIGRERRLCRVNGAPAKSQASFGEFLTVQWLVPAMDRLFEDGRSERRRFLDRLAGGADPEHGTRVLAYEVALRERGRILRGEVSAAARDLSTWLDGLEAEMSALAGAIGAARLEIVRLLNQALDETTGPFPRADLAVRGAFEEWLCEGSALMAEDRLRQRLGESRKADGAAGFAQWGTHRSDLEVRHAGRELGGRRSGRRMLDRRATGAPSFDRAAQSRLAGRTSGRMPVLLLDEALAHLDSRRRDGLFEEVLALGLQAWLTGADREAFRGLSGRAQFIDLENGQTHSIRE
jgi:DNA replication and repair protein RecF